MTNSLKVIQTKIENFTSSCTKKEVFCTIKDFCNNLKEEVKLATNNAVQQIYDLSENMIACIEDYQNELIKAPIEIEIKDFTKTLDEIKLFHTKWSDYLKQIKLTDQPLIDANKLAFEIIQKQTMSKRNFIIRFLILN